ncbi:PREDICTED: uncharacterized protein LOC109208395 [Nicotiana attenuata]|uniref:uncharacterized protein LOC109208395 n=1 Tax=Nicotiana attenuata TaxID=49451 RepID=UPI0009059C9F|nr:PREDICTED: uncharacterized protein LOC109208395 [Nicotiana attenuata]
MLEPSKTVEDIEIGSDQGNNLGEAIQISLSLEERHRIYEPWKFSIIIKLVGKRMPHHYLKRKIQDLWKPMEEFSLIDLGEDYYIIKFTKKENMDKAIHLGPWFINGHFLSISEWKPNFVAKNAKLTSSAVWVRLPQLPTEFYDGKILEKIVQSFLYVGDHKQDILYEGEDFLCKNYGRFGHTQRQCNYIKMQNLDPHHAGQEQHQEAPHEACDSEWKTVPFNKKKNQGKKTPTQVPTIQANGSQGPGIPVKLFNAKTVPINGQEAIVILHNTQYLAQLITEGMRLAMNNYLNQVWLNNVIHPMAPSLNTRMAQTMREQWNMPPQFNSMHPLNAPLDLPFFPTEMYTHLNPIFLPWDVNLGNQGNVPLPQPPPVPPPPQQEYPIPGPVEAEMEEDDVPLNPHLDRALKPKWNKHISIHGKARKKVCS